MHRLWGRTARVLGALAAAAGAACGSNNDAGPSQSPPVIAKATTKNGDQQTGAVNAALPSELRVVVTRDGNPAPDMVVNWVTDNGSLSPGSDKTDAEGVSFSVWTLGGTPGVAAATASVTGATGSPVTFTATVTGSGPEATVQVLGNGGSPNQFSPADITVSAGTTVTWQWADDAVGHNVVADAGDIPPPSGDLTNGPHTYEFTFTVPGIYHYHCQAHGASGGVGMSGTVTVGGQL